MNKFKVVLISGLSGSGKTTIAEYLTRKYNFVNFALGDKVKELTYDLLKLFNVPINSIKDLYNEQTKHKYRHYMQQISTECCKKCFGKNIWCQTLTNSPKFITAVKNGYNIVISDIRFTEEQEYFKKLSTDVITINIKRDGLQQMKHISESQINLSFDYELSNNSDIKNVYAQIDKILLQKEQQEKTNSINDFEEDENDEENDNQQTEEENYEIVEEVIKEEEYKERAINPKELMEQDTAIIDNKEHIKNFSPYALGKIGEENVAQLIQAIRPNYETTIVAKTGHLGDIITIDYDRNIKYVLEIKLKQNITKNDIDKFDRDLITAINANTQYKNIIGLFISLNSSSIPSKGSLSISKDKIYLTSAYITSEAFEIIFKMLESYNDILQATNIKTVSTEVKYTIPQNVYTLINSLRLQYNNLNNEYETLLNMRDNNDKTQVYINQLLIQNEMRKIFIKFLNDEFKDVLPIIENDLMETEEDRLIKYLEEHNTKNILKNDLIKEFPTFATEIGNLGKKDFINKYLKKSDVVEEEVKQQPKNKTYEEDTDENREKLKEYVQKIKKIDKTRLFKYFPFIEEEYKDKTPKEIKDMFN